VQTGSEWERGVNRECLVVSYFAQAFAAWRKPVSMWQELDSFLSLASSRQSMAAARFPGLTTANKLDRPGTSTSVKGSLSPNEVSGQLPDGDTG
jgi:hypothetical protein